MKKDDPDSICPEIVRGEDFCEVCKEMQLKKAFSAVLCENQEAAQNTASALC